MGRSPAPVDASEQGTSRGKEWGMTEDRWRCGWGAVLAAVTLFAILLLSVPAGPGTG
jgi:hypothetical protein